MTVNSFDPNAPVVSVTAAAIKHFEKKLEKADGQIVRLDTKVSGCTGYRYVLDFVEAAEADDKVQVLNDKVTLAISPAALKLVRGTEIDFVLEGINRVVKFNNPNVVSECGCGESFSVEE
ncbi:HesB/IscA family protein [Salinibius halmophilus]|uniref:HesB/IscA family protein n=1 Tax=Salinibius halmophilus TaxID=1853216 RepID=UPI000E66026A|nr:iron-sulfur cluster assembly accessory protein [Salinibius halmophilus]